MDLLGASGLKMKKGVPSFTLFQSVRDPKACIV
jgi:hypothetical protein